MPTAVEYALIAQYQGVMYPGSVLPPCAPKSAGGIRRVWVGDRAAFGTWRLEQTSPLQYARISASSLPGIWYPLYPQWQAATFAELAEPMPTRAYLATLNLPYSRMDETHRDIFERLVASNKAVFLAEDLNGNAWLFGEHDGCLVGSAFESQAAGGVGTYSIQAACRQTFPLRRVNSAYLEYVKGFAPATTVNTTTLAGTTLIALVNVQATAILTLFR